MAERAETIYYYYRIAEERPQKMMKFPVEEEPVETGLDEEEIWDEQQRSEGSAAANLYDGTLSTAARRLTELVQLEAEARPK